MNFIIEDNIDFYKQLHEIDSEDEHDDEDLCLLTKMPLDQNKIVLPCNHSFNLYPLYKEVCKQKLGSSALEISRLRHDQMKCPYCRRKYNFVLPRLLINKKMKYHSGVNSPEKICMKSKSPKFCSYHFKSGINKNVQCRELGYYTEYGCYCMKHQSSVSKKMTNNNTTLHKCSAILQSGARKGEVCNAKTSNAEADLCRRHNKNK